MKAQKARAKEMMLKKTSQTASKRAPWAKISARDLGT
jgi:hypothetical protein